MQFLSIFLIKSTKIYNIICVDEDVVDFVSTNEEIKETVDDLFNKLNLHCEGGSLSATKKSDERVLVTDNQFLANLANSEKIANIGLVPFLLCSNFSWKRLLTISKKLKRINFNNYLPLVLYKRMVDALLESNDEIETSSSEIQEWIISDSDDDPTSHHEDIVLELCKEVIVQDLNYLNPDNLLGKLTIRILEKRNPGFIQRCIENMFTTS